MRNKITSDYNLELAKLLEAIHIELSFFSH